MSSKVYLKSEMTMVTAETARLLRDTCHFSRQRQLSESHIERLADEMDRGSFIPGTQIAFGVFPDKRMVILNGNHTLEAVAQSGVPIALTFTYIPVKDEDDVGRIYAQYDIHRVRSWGDAYKAYGFTENMPTYWASPIGTALGVIMARFDSAIAKDPVLKSREVRALVMRRYAKQSAQLMELVEGVATQNLKLFRRGGVLSVALETLRYQPSMASEFWRGFLLDDGLKTGDPRKTLLNYLRARTGATNRGDRDQQSRACALAWNASFKGRKLEILRPAYMIDIRIEGTPWVRANFNPMADVSAPRKFEATIPAQAVITPSFTSGKTMTADGESKVVFYGA